MQQASVENPTIAITINIVLRPSGAGVPEFQTRIPRAMAEEFA